MFAGQVLARLEDSIQQQVLADARAQHRLAERQLERAESLHRRGSAGYRLAEANLRLAEANLSYTLVKSPFDGTVSDVFKEHYESVAAGEPVVTVYRNSRVDVLIDIPDILPARVHQARDVSSLEAQAIFRVMRNPIPCGC